MRKLRLKRLTATGLSAVRIDAYELFAPKSVFRYTKILARPDGLFALRAHPFGVALWAINSAEDGGIVEPPTT
jgi:hypothetical protein